MPRLKGTQLRNNTITTTQIDAAYTNALLKADGSTPASGNLNMAGFRVTGLPQPTAADEPARLQDLQLVSWKTVARVATTGNIALTGIGQSVDGVTIAAGDRVLVWRQTNAAENGLYISASGAWARASDADSAAEIRGARIPVESGTANGDHSYTLITDSITLGTTSLTFVDLGSASPAAYPRIQSGLVCNSVSVNYGVASATAIAATPTNGGAVAVRINGVEVYVGADRTSEGYFTRDNGASAVALNGVQAGDLFAFNSLIAGYQIDATDTMSFAYSV